MKLWNLLIVGAVTLVSTSLGRAEDVYVSQIGAGLQDGSSLPNARSLAWLNSSANWGAGATKVSAGDTVHLVGIFTSPLTVQGNGSSGAPISILFEPGARFTAPVWPDASGAIDLQDHSWIIVDGGNTGLIENTANGTTLSNQTGTTGVNGSWASHIVVQNVTIARLYQRTPGSTLDGNRHGYAVKLQNANDVTVRRCNLTDGDTMIALTWSTGSRSNWVVTGNTIGRCNHGITIGTATVNAYLHNVTISSNIIDNLDVWDGEQGLHLDGIIVFNEAPDYSGCLSNLWIHANYIGPRIGITNTAAVFIDTYRPSQIVGMRIYNNVFTAVAPYSWSNGFIAVGSATNSIIANNTFIGYSGTGTGVAFASGAAGISNNLFFSVGTPLSLGPAASVPGGFQSDYNLFYDSHPGSGSFFGPGYNAADLTWWQARGYDNHSSVSRPLLDAEYVPTAADVAARDKGVDLSSFFASDKAGVARGFGGAWDIGAYEYGGIKPSSTPPSITLIALPSSIATGQSSRLTWTSANATSVSITELGSVALNGSASVSPSSSTTYTATATGAGGAQAVTAMVVVTTNPPSGRVPGVPFSATGGVVTAPFEISGGSVSQATGTGIANGGRASYLFTVSVPGDYGATVILDAPNDAANSLYVSVDAEPEDPSMICDIPITSGFEERVIAWRGTGTFDSPQFVQKFFTLSAGEHELIIRGRAGGVRLQSIAILRRPAPPVLFAP